MPEVELMELPATRRIRPRRAVAWQCAHGTSRRAPQQLAKGTASARTASPPRVLVVDDEAPVRLICRFNLAAAGMVVREAADGEQALAAISTEAPDLVLLDVMMPRVDGWDVARRLAADPRTRAIPIVFLTARTSQADRAAAHELGAVGFILKPFDPIDLPGHLERILERLARGQRAALRRELLEGRG